MKAAKILLVLVCAQEAYSCVFWLPCDCTVSDWSSWSSCSSVCNGQKSRHRHKTRHEKDGGKCHYSLHEYRPCNKGRCRHGSCRSGTCHCQTGWAGTYCNVDRNECQMNPKRCHPGGTCVNKQGSYRCDCHRGYASKHGGTACEDVDECLRSPCQHHCTNTPGSYRCHCHSCYTKVGRRCELRKCKIGGRCYAYGMKNPSNACQECNSNKPRQWTNNNNLPCSDKNVLTKNDRCVNGVCRGTPISCLPCETHDRRGCHLKRGYFVIQQYNGVRSCHSIHQLKLGKSSV